MPGTLFLALRVPAPQARELAPLLSRLGELDPALRPVRGDGLHLTLQFLGRVPEEVAGKVAEVAYQVASRHPPFELSLGGMGFFPSPARPAVVWLAAKEGAEPTRSLAEALGRELETRALPFDARPLRLHCSLARVRGRMAGEGVRGLTELAEQEGSRPPLTVLATALELLESVPQTQGPNRYRTRELAPLEGT